MSPAYYSYWEYYYRYAEAMGCTMQCSTPTKVSVEYLLCVHTMPARVLQYEYVTAGTCINSWLTEEYCTALATQLMKLENTLRKKLFSLKLQEGRNNNDYGVAFIVI